MGTDTVIILFFFFALIIASFAFEKLDFVAISLLSCSLAATITVLSYNLPFQKIISFIDFEAIIIILSFSIISKIAQDSHLLEYIAIRLFRISKGNLRIFFYLLCMISAFLSSIITDVIVVIILVPMVIRLCKYLKTKAGTYLLGIAICINIGSIITPFSSGENLIISSFFNLDLLYFIRNYWLFSFFILFLSIYLLDQLVLKREENKNKELKDSINELLNIDIFELFLEIERPRPIDIKKRENLTIKTIIKYKKIIYINGIGIIITMIFLAIIPAGYLVSLISATLLVLINQKYTRKKMNKILRNVEWEVIFFFIALYITVGCLLEAGFREIIESIPFLGNNPFVLDIMILLIVSALSGLIVNTPVAVIFNPIVSFLIVDYGLLKDHVLFSFIMGVNISSNFLPHGAVSDMMTLKIAREENVSNISYKRLFRYGALFAVIHTILAIGYLLLLIIFL